MSKASRNRRRVNKVLKPTSTVERNARWGANVDPDYDIDGRECRQPTSITVQSVVTNSASLGLVPSVLITYTHVPLVGPGEPVVTRIMLVGTAALMEHVVSLNEVADRAHLDTAAGLRLD